MNCLTCTDRCLSLYLSNADMQSFGIDYSALSYSNELSRKMLRFFIELAKVQTGFTEKRPTFMECTPDGDGCIVKITNSTPCEIKLHCVAFGELSQLLRIARAINSQSEICLWHTENTFALSFCYNNSDALICADFCDFSTLEGSTFSIFTEHSICIFSGKAETLGKLAT